MIYLKITEWDGFVTTPMPLIYILMGLGKITMVMKYFLIFIYIRGIGIVTNPSHSVIFR